jgi:polar amino acid transport system substrate-binding protein
VDAPGVRIVARPRSAYDLFLRRSITQATLVYPEAGEADIDVLASGRGDVLAGLRHVLVDTARETPDVRVLDGRFAAMGQAIGIPRGSETAASYLRAFVEDLKGSGLVAQAIAASGAEGVSVAPPAVDSAP